MSSIPSPGAPLPTFEQYNESQSQAPFEPVSEMSLSRVVQHQQDPEAAFIMVTAFRSEFSAQENLARNKQLIARVRGLHLGFAIVKGYWVENTEADFDARDYQHEDTLFIPLPRTGWSDAKKVKDLARELIYLFPNPPQDAAVVKYPGDTKVKLLFSSGEEMDIGVARPDRMGNAYTVLKKGRGFVFEAANHRGFVLESIQVPGNFLGKKAFSLRGQAWEL